ncbi:MAG: ATP-binding protein [bacterium]
MKLKTKLSLLTSLLILCIIAGITGFLFLSEKKFLVNESRLRKEHIGASLAEVSKEYFIGKEEIPLFNYLKEIQNIPEVSYALVTDTTGKILAHTDINLLWKNIDDLPSMYGSPADPSPTKTLKNTNNEKISDIVYPVVVGNAITGFARIGFSLNVIERSIHHMLIATRNRIFGIGFIALIIGIIGAIIIAKRITGPIQSLSDGAIRIGKGNLDEKIAVNSHDEIGTLAEQFNDMAAELKELDQLKADFVASVTHELRSPLTSLGMYIGLFHEGAAGKLNDKTHEYLDIMQKNVDRLRRFIDTLLDISKLERGKMDFLQEPIDPSLLIKEVQDLFKPQAETKKIQFNIEIPENPPYIFADADKSIQILINLVSNAFKFTEEKGTVNVTISPQGKNMLFSVTDTGIGIHQKDIGKIFNKFEQVREVRDQIDGTAKGTGLGLAIVKNLVELQGGRIWVESKLNKGSSFHFTLPRAET